MWIPCLVDGSRHGSNHPFLPTKIAVNSFCPFFPLFSSPGSNFQPTQSTAGSIYFFFFCFISIFFFPKYTVCVFPISTAWVHPTAATATGGLLLLPHTNTFCSLIAPVKQFQQPIYHFANIIKGENALVRSFQINVFSKHLRHRVLSSMFAGWGGCKSWFNWRCNYSRNHAFTSMHVDSKALPEELFRLSSGSTETE